MSTPFAAFRVVIATFFLGLAFMPNPPLAEASLQLAPNHSERTNDLQPAPTQPAPGPQGRIVFVAGPQEGDAEIYTLSLEGGRPLNLTQDPARDVSPQLSSDGKTLAFLSNRTGNC